MLKAESHAEGVEPGPGPMGQLLYGHNRANPPASNLRSPTSPLARMSLASRHAHWFRSRGRLGGLVICCGAMLQHVSSSLRLPLCRLHAESRKNAGTE
jgi:hypothetical protein